MGTGCRTVCTVLCSVKVHTQLAANPAEGFLCGFSALTILRHSEQQFDWKNSSDKQLTFSFNMVS